MSSAELPSPPSVGDCARSAGSVSDCAVPADVAVCTVKVLGAPGASVAALGERATLKSLLSELKALQLLERSSQIVCTVNIPSGVDTVASEKQTSAISFPMVSFHAC